jgi:hypothetical protein
MVNSNEQKFKDTKARVNHHKCPRSLERRKTVALKQLIAKLKKQRKKRKEAKTRK